MIQLQTTLRQLRLSGLMQTLDVRLQEAAGARLGHGEFLELILQDELNVRHQRMLARRTKAAEFRGLNCAFAEIPIYFAAAATGFAFGGFAIGAFGSVLSSTFGSTPVMFCGDACVRCSMMSSAAL